MVKRFDAVAVGMVVAMSSFAVSAQIVLYENDNFSGRSYRASSSVSNLNEGGFNDKASSVTVRGGKWQLCDDAYFRGNCVTLGPGEYPSLRTMSMNDKVSSVRELGWTPDGSGGWSGNDAYNSDSGYNNRYTKNGNNYQGGNWGTGSRAVLFAGPNLSGEAFVVSADGVSNLDRSGFNDKARSLRVEAGYWLFCTDAEFQGDCHTYGPGDYPNLVGGQNRNISSGRRISGNYPYRNNPNWNDASPAPASSGSASSAQIGAVPPVVKDLVGARASGAESDMEKRGLKFVRTETSGNGKNSYWRELGTKGCIFVRTENGRIDNASYTEPQNCDGGAASSAQANTGSASSVAIGSVPPVVKDLVGARAAGAESEMEQRGLKFVRTETSGNGKNAYWRELGTGGCIFVRTENGRIDNASYTEPQNCGRGSN